MKRLLIILALVAALLAGCGGKSVRPPLPPPPPPPPIEEGSLPSVRALGAWSYEVGGNLDLGKVAASLEFGNCVTIKQRDHQNGFTPALQAIAANEGAWLWGIAQGGREDFEKDLNFLLALQATGKLAGAFIGLDEPDLRGDYSPAALDRLHDAFRARGVTVPLFVNLAVAVGLPGNVGIDLIRARGVPLKVGLGLEAYHLTADRWVDTMAPAVLEVLRFSAPGQPLALIPGMWQAPGQPLPTEAMAWAPFRSWSLDPAFAPYRDRLVGVIAYRWSTDRAAGDCKFGIEDLGGPKAALARFKQVNGL